MLLRFGLNIQSSIIPPQSSIVLNTYFVRPTQFLHLLEDHLGLSVPDNDIEYLRIEQYRQALNYYLDQNKVAFYESSFEADDLGVAVELLHRRDELVLAGWNFDYSDQTPIRLKVLAIIESYLKSDENTLKLFAGEADRLQKVKKEIARASEFISQIELCDEWAHFPVVWQQILTALKTARVKLHLYNSPANFKDNDLGVWQKYLSGQQKGRLNLKGDGSLRIIRAYRETHMAAYLAKIIQKNGKYNPIILLPQAKRTLENSFMMEGLPSLGVASASLARPSLQVLKLVSVFLWKPLDINKIMEFVALTIKPLEEGLANRIAGFIADTPGLYSDRWFAMINDYFKNELPEKNSKRNHLNLVKIEQEFHFWFSRKRVDSRSEKVDKKDVRAIYDYLHKWAVELARQEETPASIRVLVRQSAKLVELLDTLPETELNYLELERIVRTIYEPAPVKYRQAEANKLDTVHHVGAIANSVDSLVWWDFFENDKDYFFSKWYPNELEYLANNKIELETPAAQNERLLSQRKRPVLWTQNQLLLCIPEYCDGEPVQAHPLLGDLEAAFGEEGIDAISYHIDQQTKERLWEKTWRLPLFEKQNTHSLATPQPFVQLDQEIDFREEETPTSIEQILYYPYQWVFKHQIKLRKSNLLSVVEDNRLYGNLSHKLIETLLKQDFYAWSKSSLEQWVSNEIPGLLEKQGTNLLMYGKEPERIAFIKYMKFAAWSLVCLLKDNQWKVLGTEYALEGKWQNVGLKGRADLVLQKEGQQAIVDLKWRGASRYANVLRNSEDIQLALYANLFAKDGKWPHTSYFIIDKGKMIARNNQAFTNAQAVLQEADHEQIYDDLMAQVVATFEWRKAQLKNGEVEVRCANTYRDLENIYGEHLLDLLEMKTDDARFDDYSVLIGLVR